MKQGTLYVVATPIGNLADMSARAIEVLGQVNLIAAEDTRHSQYLLAHFSIKTPMTPYHDHNEAQQTPVLIEKLRAGASIALVSDAGTPLLSDPGYRLVNAAHEAGLPVSPVPGPCAAIAALSAAGLATDRFLFAGFTPSKSSARKLFFEELAHESATLVFYETSHRIVASLKDMAAVLGGQRLILLAREISKTFETLHRAELGAMCDWVQADANQQKGEFVLVVQGAEKQAAGAMQDVTAVLAVLLEELPLKQASALAARLTGEKKNLVYKMALALQPDGI
jgi:16S rRNA (cytidine1402-2'-O)-methyltransferase